MKNVVQCIPTTSNVVVVLSSIELQEGVLRRVAEIPGLQRLDFIYNQDISDREIMLLANHPGLERVGVILDRLLLHDLSPLEEKMELYDFRNFQVVDMSTPEEASSNVEWEPGAFEIDELQG